MKTVPTLETPRLALRPFELADARDVQRLAGDRDVAAMTLTIPHPYTDGLAEQWIAAQEVERDQGQQVVLAITLRQRGELVGAIGLSLTAEHARAELGYWVGRPYWGRGYATEASSAVLDHAFGTLGLNRVHAAHFVGNDRSRRVLLKIGMVHEGRLRQHCKRFDAFLDVETYGILAADHARRAAGPRGTR